MSATKLANRYAKSLLDLSIEKGLLEEVSNDVQGIQQVIRSSRELYLMLKSPIVKEDKKRMVIGQLFENKVHEITLAFLRIVVDKKREGFLPEILQAFVDQYYRVKEITPVKLITAVEVDEATKDRITALVKEKYGKKHVLLSTQQDQTIKGGFVVEFDNMQYDASLAHKFEQLRKEFNTNPYIKTL